MASILVSEDPTNLTGLAQGSGKQTVQTSQAEIYGADEETLFRLFRSKIKHALAEAGYDEAAQTTVTNLVERNIVSCGITLRGLSGQDTALQADLVQPQLEDLLSNGVRINSNEPVLLILIDAVEEEVSLDTATAIKDASCTVLRATFGIFPVRVYVARHPAGKSRGTPSQSGFSLALLNVVNTNIGSPSMIQLLDAEAASPDWEKMIVMAEGWHQSELLWRKTELRQAEISVNNHIADTEALVATAPDIIREHDEPAVIHPKLEDSVSVENSVESVTSNSSSRRTSVSKSTILVEHPAMTELLAREANRPAIQYPTWEHVHMGESLIDLIRMQASSLSESELVDVANESVPGQVNSSRASEADFEIV